MRTWHPVHDFRASHGDAQRHARSKAFCHANHIRFDARVLDRPPLAGAANATLHLIQHQQDAVTIADAAQLLHEAGGCDQVAALTLHGLDEDRGHFLRSERGLEQLLFDEAGATQRESIGVFILRIFSSAIQVGIGYVSYARHQRRKAAPLLWFRGGQRQRAHRPSMKRAEERDDVLAFGVIARQLERALDCLRARVAIVKLVRARHGSDLRQVLSERDQILVIKICARHVDQLARLLLNGGDHIGMAVPGRGHGDAGGEVIELVAVHVGDDDAAATLGHQRVGACIRRRNILLVAREHALGVGPGQVGLDLGSLNSGSSFGHGLGGHRILRKAVASGR